MKFSFDKFVLIVAFVFLCVNFGFAQTEYEKGIELYRQGKNKEAVAALEKASKQNETDAKIWNYLGLAYVKGEELKKAIKSFEKAAEFDSRNPIYRANLGYAYLLGNKPGKARNESTKAVELNPQNAMAYYVRGTASVWEGDFDDAIADAERAIAADPNYSQAYTLKSDALLSNFGSRVGSGGSKPIDEVELLQQSREVLETCLKDCQNNSQAEVQRDRLEMLTAFYNYFSKNKDTVLGQTPSAPAAPDPNASALKLLSKKAPSYTDQARASGVSGTVRLAVLFSESGQVTHTLTLKSLGYGLDEAAVRAARAIKFEPAKKDGKPISQIRIVEYSFSFF